jgi:hypothetical protein
MDTGDIACAILATLDSRMQMQWNTFLFIQLRKTLYNTFVRRDIPVTRLITDIRDFILWWEELADQIGKHWRWKVIC